MTDGEILESNDTMRVRIVRDDDPSNPRQEYDQCVHVATVPNRSYHDVDKDAGPYERAWRYYFNPFRDWHRACELFQRYVSILGGVADLYTPVNGPAAVWYLTHEDIERESLPDPLKTIKAEQSEYQSWANGDVYGYVIEECVQWRRADGTTGDTMETWEHVDSCFGFYGYEYAVESAREAWADATAQ